MGQHYDARPGAGRPVRSETRLHALDTLRGVAALSVVLWHWQHFFAISGSWTAGWLRSAQPFFVVLKPFYEIGWAAVDLFFALSGFIFFWLYGDAIASGAMRAGRFALLRFSRLYPLHVATFLLVAALEAVFQQKTGNYFVYDSGSWVTALRTLFMAQQWTPPTLDQTFNGPAWSVSIEVLLYGIFFAVMRAGLKGARIAIDIVVIGIIIFFLYNEMVGRGIAGFFAGGIVYRIVERIKRRSDARRIALLIAGAAIASWAIIAIMNYLDLVPLFDHWFAGGWSRPAIGFYLVERSNVLLLAFILIVTPLTLAALALHEQVLGGRYERFSFLGDISYSSYLLHFPMQLSLALIALRMGWHPETFQHGWVMIVFYVVLIALATASYHFFERPLQSLIRGYGARTLFPAE